MRVKVRVVTYLFHLAVAIFKNQRELRKNRSERDKCFDKKGSDLAMCLTRRSSKLIKYSSDMTACLNKNRSNLDNYKYEHTTCLNNIKNVFSLTSRQKRQVCRACTLTIITINYCPRKVRSVGQLLNYPECC